MNKLSKMRFFVIIISFCSTWSITTCSAVAQTAVEKLYAEYGVKFSVSEEFKAQRGRKLYYISQVSADGHFDKSGFSVGDIIRSTNGGGGSYKVINSFTSVRTANLETYANNWLYHLKDSGVVYGRRSQLDLARKYFNDSKKYYKKFSLAALPKFVLPHNRMRQHLGLQIKSGPKYTVLVDKVVPGGIADFIGLKVGDQLLQMYPRGAFNASLNQGLRNMYQLVSRVKTPTYINILRGGKRHKLRMPNVAWGQSLPEANPKLTTETTKYFAAFPEPSLNFFKAIFLADYNEANHARDQFFKRYYNGSVLQLLSPLTPNLRNSVKLKVARSRLEGLMAQYILVKSNSIGVCGQSAQGYIVTTEFYRALSNGYGVILSKKKIGEKTKPFKVPSRFAKIVNKARPTKEFASWSNNFKRLIVMAGGCNSKFLRELENNMITYSKS